MSDSLSALRGFCAAVFLLLALPPTSLASDSIRGFYIGGGTNWGGIEVSDDDCDYFYTYVDCNNDSGDNEFGFVVNAGYRFGKYIAVEAGYVDYGELGYDEDLVYLSDLLDLFNTDVELDLTATHISVVGVAPFGNGLEGYAKGGIIFYDGTSEQELTNSFSGEVVRRTIEEDETELYLGLGIGYSFGRYSHVRLEINGYGLEDNLVAAGSDRNASLTNFVLEYHLRFGKGWQR